MFNILNKLPCCIILELRDNTSPTPKPLERYHLCHGGPDVFLMMDQFPNNSSPPVKLSIKDKFREEFIRFLNDDKKKYGRIHTQSAYNIKWNDFKKNGSIDYSKTRCNGSCQKSGDNIYEIPHSVVQSDYLHTFDINGIISGHQDKINFGIIYNDGTNDPLLDKIIKHDKTPTPIFYYDGTFKTPKDKSNKYTVKKNNPFTIVTSTALYSRHNVDVLDKNCYLEFTSSILHSETFTGKFKTNNIIQIKSDMLPKNYLISNIDKRYKYFYIKKDNKNIANIINNYINCKQNFKISESLVNYLYSNKLITENQYSAIQSSNHQLTEAEISKINNNFHNTREETNNKTNKLYTHFFNYTFDNVDKDRNFIQKYFFRINKLMNNKHPKIGKIIDLIVKNNYSAQIKKKLVSQSGSRIKDNNKLNKKLFTKTIIMNLFGSVNLMYNKLYEPSKWVSSTDTNVGTTDSYKFSVTTQSNYFKKGYIADELNTKLYFYEKVIVSKDSNVITIGDLHSSLASLCQILNKLKCKNYFENNDTFKLYKNNYIIFLGDLVDRGSHSIEILGIVFALKKNNVNNVFIINGNHEDKKTYDIYGLTFEYEKEYKYRVFNIKPINTCKKRTLPTFTNDDYNNKIKFTDNTSPTSKPSNYNTFFEKILSQSDEDLIAEMNQHIAKDQYDNLKIIISKMHDQVREDTFTSGKPELILESVSILVRNFTKYFKILNEYNNIFFVKKNNIENKSNYTLDINLNETITIEKQYFIMQKICDYWGFNYDDEEDYYDYDDYNDHHFKIGINLIKPEIKTNHQQLILDKIFYDFFDDKYTLKTIEIYKITESSKKKIIFVRHIADQKYMPLDQLVDWNYLELSLFNDTLHKYNSNILIDLDTEYQIILSCSLDDIIYTYKLKFIVPSESTATPSIVF